jgi:hypothetical protein
MTATKKSPEIVTSLLNQKIGQVSCGFNHTVTSSKYDVTPLCLYFFTLSSFGMYILMLSLYFVLNTQCPSQKQFDDTYGQAFLNYVKCKMYSNLQTGFVVPIFVKVSVLAKRSSLNYFWNVELKVCGEKGTYFHRNSNHPSPTFEILSGLFLFFEY